MTASILAINRVTRRWLLAALLWFPPTRPAHDA